MPKMSHINVIEKYEEHRAAIHYLLSSIVRCFADNKLFEKGQKDLSKSLESLCAYYPFISLLYLLDPSGKQICKNIYSSRFNYHIKTGMGVDRAKRPYYLLAMSSNDVIVTDPYLSSIRRELCLSASIKVTNDEDAVKGIIVLDVDLELLLTFLTGDSHRTYFDPYFKVIYSTIVTGLFIVALLLLYLAGKECWIVLKAIFIKTEENKLLPFGVVIYLTLALAIFDLGKTTLEEEVLLYKDILSHSSTRRTITRFISAIIIAVSIEALLMVFKSAVQGSGEYMIQAVWVILAAGFLLLCLAVYVYLGSKAEVILVQSSAKNDLN